MIAVVRSELYRGLTIRSSWLALIGFAFLAGLFGWFSEDFWSLFAGVGAFGVAVIVTAQHYQHRTAVLLFLTRPHRWRVLIGQVLVGALYGVVLAAISGVAVLREGDPQYGMTVLVAPLMAVFGTLCVTVVRHPLWLFAGAFGWVLFVEGMINRGENGGPFAAFMLAAAADDLAGLFTLLSWIAAAIPLALWSIYRDLSGD